VRSKPPPKTDIFEGMRIGDDIDDPFLPKQQAYMNNFFGRRAKPVQVPEAA
jgi:hypothetical protein